MKKILSVLASVSLVAAFAFVATAQAAPAFEIIPFEYLADGETCDVQADWVTDPASSTNKILQLKKGCPTATVAAAGADIVTPLEGQPIANLTELNFEYREGGHCGAGAPRFNVVVDGNYYFLGCTQGEHSSSTMAGWTRVVFDADDFAAAGIPVTGTLDDVYIIFDEGTDTPAGGSIGSPGEVFIDNISVNADIIGSPTTPLSKDDCKKGGYEAFGFKNQGQCVASIVSNKDHVKNQ